MQDPEMRIAFLLKEFPAVSETFILRQITGLIDLGHEVDIYADYPPEDGATHAEIERYRLLERTTYVRDRLPADSGYWEMPVWPLTSDTWLPGAEKPIRNASRVLRAVPAVARGALTRPALTLKTLSRHEFGHQAASLSALYRMELFAARRVHYDALHAHYGPVGNMFRFARELWRAPLIVTFHGYDYCKVPRQEGPGVYARLFQSVDRVTIHSDYGRERLEQLGCPPEKLYKLRMGVDPAEFPFRERVPAPGETVRMVTVARLVEIKGLEYAVRAVAALRETHPGVRYDIIGEGPLRPALEALIRELGVEDTVFLHGARDGGYVRRALEEAHLFVLPSIDLHGDQEGTPVSLMEAQAVGLPIVATRTGGIPEVVPDGEAGFLVPDRDAEALRERLAYLVDHPECWPKMGRRGRKQVETFYDVRSLNRELELLYRQIAGC